MLVLKTETNPITKKIIQTTLRINKNVWRTIVENPLIFGKETTFELVKEGVKEAETIINESLQKAEKYFSKGKIEMALDFYMKAQEIEDTEYIRTQIEICNENLK